MSTPLTSTGPANPEQSSQGVPVGGFRQWFVNIIEWIKALSPAGATSYETNWIPITLASGYETVGSAPSVKRVGREIRFKGAVRRVGAGTWATGLHTVGSVPTEFAPVIYRDTVSALWPDPTAASSVFGTVASGTGAIEIRIPSGLTNATLVHLKGLSGYEVN